MLLPSLSITLVKTKACASQGLEVNLHRNSMMAVKEGLPSLTSGSLEQLSGGQRTLVSLALLLSAAQVSLGGIRWSWSTWSWRSVQAYIRNKNKIVCRIVF